jgi:branched-chain amino acid transport system permease protein
MRSPLRLLDALRPAALRRFDLALVAGAFIVLAQLLRMQRTTDFIIFCIFVVAFDLLYGYMGRLSFGHMLHLGTGAYAAALCAEHLCPNPLVGLLVATASGGAVGLLLGPIAVRTTGACFALINLAFNQVGYFLALVALARWTGGEDGMAASFSAMGPVNFGRAGQMFALALGSLLGVIWLARRLTGSPFGTLLRTIKEKEERVRFLGYDTRRYKLVAFVVSTSVAALAGGLSAVNYGYVSPSFIDPSRNVDVIFAALIGGAGSVHGALIGGVAYMTISNWLPNQTQRWEMLLGVALLLLVFRFQGGIWGWLTARAGARRGAQP